MSAHTPGPWIRDKRTVYALMHAGWRKGVELFKNRFWVTVQKDPECSEEEADANARLIAAAPDLLAVAEMISNGPHDAEAIADMLPSVRAAIAKAEGES